MNNWRNLPLFKMFMPKPKRKGRGAMWASLFGLGVSAAVFGMTKGKRSNFAIPFKDTVQNMTPKLNVGQMDIGRMDNAALAEFSEELLESSLNKK